MPLPATRSATGLVLLDGCAWRGTELPGERTHALLAALALEPGRVVSDSRLIDEVWGGDLPLNPTKALQVLVSRVRAMTGPEVITRSGIGYRLTAADVDVWVLRDATEQAAAAFAAGDTATAQTAAELGLAVPVGATADGLDPVAVLHARARADQRRARGVLGRTLSRLGAHPQAVDLLEAAWGEQPDDEGLLADLLRSETATRGAAAALERFEGYRSDLRDRLGADPGPDLRSLHAELLVHDRPVRTGLRWDPSRLIGREDDLAALTRLTRTDRVTSIIGAGGLGKTRLAHAVGRLAEQSVVHFVELAGVSTADGVATEVGSVVGVREPSGRRPPGPAARANLTDRIVERVTGLPTLLIMDNCEHVVDAVAELVAVLIGRAPRLHVLTTSRAPLGLAAEQVYPLGQLDPTDAAVLFTERAVAARPGARLDPTRVTELVERLDGLPLAIELAAAKVKVMSVDEISRRLENRFALLRGGSRDAPARHQTLLAVIDWSWNLLTTEQRVALRRLSVFRDGFSLTAAGSVIGVPDAVDLVSALVDQSLLTVVEGDEIRYRMLETVREFGRMQLIAAGDDAATDEALRRWARGFAGEQSDDLYGRGQVAAVTRLHREEGNLADVLVTAVDTADRLTTVLVAAALCALWTIEGFHLKVVNLVTRVEPLLLDRSSDAADDRLVTAERAVLTSILINTMIFAGAPSPRSLDRLREIGPGAGPAHVRATATVLLAFGSASAGDLFTSLADLRRSTDPAVVRMANGWASQAYENAGDVTRALEASRAGMAVTFDDEGPWSLALLRSQTAELEAAIGHHSEARGYAEASLPVMDDLGAVEDATQLRSILAMVCMTEGRLDEAERILDEITTSVQLEILRGGGVAVSAGRAELALARGQGDDGIRLYRESLTRLREHSVAWVDEPQYAPWVIYPESAALAAHVRAGRRDEASDLFQTLRSKASRLLSAADAFLDYPVAGCALFSLGLWALSDPTGRSGDAGTGLVVLADLFSYNRTLPSLAFDRAAELAEAVCPGQLALFRSQWAGRLAADLRSVALDHILRV